MAHYSSSWAFVLGGLVSAVGCGDNAVNVDAGAVCTLELEFHHGGEGVAEPLSAPVGESRAGKLTTAHLSGVRDSLQAWAPGDFVLANDKVAMVIEDVGFSDLYDPWGGRPVGLALIEDGAIAHPSDFGEFFVLTGRYSLVTTQVSVLADGTDGGAAIVRATGYLAPTPFFENILGGVLREDYSGISTAIDYVLEPGANHVDIRVTNRSPLPFPIEQATVLHGFMFAIRMAAFGPGVGFDPEGEDVDYLAFIDDDGASFAYSVPGAQLDSGIATSGFFSVFGPGFVIPACGEVERAYARITIGGPGLNGLLATVAAEQGEMLRTISGTVRDSNGDPAEGVTVHADSAGVGYLTRAITGLDGSYRLDVPFQVTDISLTAYRQGDTLLGPLAVPDGDASLDLILAPTGVISIAATDAASSGGLPVRIQVLPTDQSIAEVPEAFGQKRPPSGRLHVEYAVDGAASLRAPVGEWEVVVSRGYEYDLFRQVVTVSANATTQVSAQLTHVVDTTGQLCGDFHIHTTKSADADDDGGVKLRSAIADGVELPVRSDHETVQSFQPEIDALGLEAWAYGLGSIEMTSMEIWGHMGVVPLEPDAAKVNGGAPLWQRFPSHVEPNAMVETLEPLEVFAQVRARPEQPAIIINHPRGGANYFEYADYDNVTGLPGRPEVWDEEFSAVEVFNDSDWNANRSGTVTDWLSLLNHGRRVFAVGSSDSHGIRRSPVGYPRTCLALGTDDPRATSPSAVRDALASGNSTVSGGIYLGVTVAGKGPGEDAQGLGASAQVRIVVQAAPWIDVDGFEVIVDGATLTTVAIQPSDAAAGNPTVRYDKTIAVPVAAAGSYVIVAASGNATLEPVHPGRRPFGVSNPIFLWQ